MANPISDCLNDLRDATDVASVDTILRTFFSTRGVEDYLFHDPCAPLTGNYLTHNLDHELTLELDRQEVWRVDPLRLQGRSRPLVWRAGAGPSSISPEADQMIWIPVADAGYQQAVLIPIYGPTGHCDVLSVLTRERQWPLRQLDHFINELVLLTYDLGGFFRNSAAAASRPDLTRRENDCLQWTARGKTAWEIAQILGITERTAHFHLQNSMRKLGAHSKHQAALAALRLGIITPGPVAQ